MKHTWKDGEVITADLLNALETTSADAAALGATNESDIGDIYGIVNAVTSKQGGAPKLADGIVKTEAVAAKAVTLAKLGTDVTARIDAGGAEVQTGTVVSTFANLKVGHVPVWNGGSIRSGVLELTNGAAEALTIPRNTAFVTALKLKPSASFLAVDMKTAEPYTFETSESGAALTCTVDLQVPAQGSLYLMIVE